MSMTSRAELIEQVAEAIYEHSEATDDGVTCMGCGECVDNDLAKHQSRIAFTVFEQAQKPTVHFMARRGGKSQALIDQMLAQANERGIRVEVVYPQAEPTDAQLRAAEEAFTLAPFSDERDGVLAPLRAALHAAAAVQTGENR